MLLNIIGLCEGGCPSSVIPSAWMSGSATTGRYTLPMTLCHMLLERAGHYVEMPDVSRSTSAEEVWRTWRFARPWIGVARDSRALALARRSTSWQELPRGCAGIRRARYAGVRGG